MQTFRDFSVTYRHQEAVECEPGLSKNGTRLGAGQIEHPVDARWVNCWGWVKQLREASVAWVCYEATCVH